MSGDRKISSWQVSKGLAGEILKNRAERRRLMTWLLLAVLGMMVGGLWVVDGWLGREVWRFLIWWGVCGGLTCWLLLMACYDALAVVKEERELAKKGREPDESGR